MIVHLLIPNPLTPFASRTERFYSRVNSAQGTCHKMRTITYFLTIIGLHLQIFELIPAFLLSINDGEVVPENTLSLSKYVEKQLILPEIMNHTDLLKLPRKPLLLLHSSEYLSVVNSNQSIWQNIKENDMVILSITDIQVN